MCGLECRLQESDSLTGRGEQKWAEAQRSRKAASIRESVQKQEYNHSVLLTAALSIAKAMAIS